MSFSKEALEIKIVRKCSKPVLHFVQSKSNVHVKCYPCPMEKNSPFVKCDFEAAQISHLTKHVKPVHVEIN